MHGSQFRCSLFDANGIEVGVQKNWSTGHCVLISVIDLFLINSQGGSSACPLHLTMEETVTGSDQCVVS